MHGVGPRLPSACSGSGVATVRDLLLFLPRGYEDRTAVVPLAQAARLEKASVAVTVVGVTDLGWGRSRTLKALVSDESGEASSLCFGRAFLRRVLVPGAQVLRLGKLPHEAGRAAVLGFRAGALEREPRRLRQDPSRLPAHRGSHAGARSESSSARALADLRPVHRAGSSRRARPRPAGVSAPRGCAARRPLPAHARRSGASAAPPWPTRSCSTSRSRCCGASGPWPPPGRACARPRRGSATRWSSGCPSR